MTATDTATDIATDTAKAAAAAVAAQATLHHQWLLGLQLMVATREGPEATGERMFRLFRQTRHHIETEEREKHQPRAAHDTRRGHRPMCRGTDTTHAGYRSQTRE